ncbi:MAG: RICIN domain-containing protein [Candidatus Sulfotelmatobacter sp.]|jgi:hypothetical protein
MKTGIMTTKRTTTYRFYFSTRMLTALPILLALCLIFPTARANAAVADRVGCPAESAGCVVNLTSIAAAPNGGLWVQVDGVANGGASRTLALDGAPQFDNVPYRGAIAAIPGRNGYWVVASDGTIYSRGDAPPLCGGRLSNCSKFPSNPDPGHLVLAVAATPDGQGFWALTEDGKVFTAGNAAPYGDVTRDSAKPSGIVATTSGRGYNIVLRDGGVYSFGDAIFYGSTGGKKPGGSDASGLAASLDAGGKINGYWMVASDGGVFTFGDASFLGSTGGNTSSSVTGIVELPDGHSYAWVYGNGKVGHSATFAKVVISSDKYGSVWSVPEGSKDPATSLQLMGADGSTSQQWNIWPTTKDGKVVQIVNVNSGLCADVTTRDKHPWGAYLIQYTCKGKTEGWDNQRFTLTNDSAGHIQFLPVDSPNYIVWAQTASSELTLIPYQGGDPTGWIFTGVK